MSIPSPKSNYQAEVKVFKSRDKKRSYIVYRIPRIKDQNLYHVFMEVEAEGAGIDCGSGLTKERSAQDHWDKLWESR